MGKKIFKKRWIILDFYDVIWLIFGTLGPSLASLKVFDAVNGYRISGYCERFSHTLINVSSS